MTPAGKKLENQIKNYCVFDKLLLLNIVIFYQKRIILLNLQLFQKQESL